MSLVVNDGSNSVNQTFSIEVLDIVQSGSGGGSMNYLFLFLLLFAFLKKREKSSSAKYAKKWGGVILTNVYAEPIRKRT